MTRVVIMMAMTLSARSADALLLKWMHFYMIRMFNTSLPALLVILIIASADTASNQNIVLIVVDDLRPSLGCYNDKNAYTPFIDKLASRSILFRNAFVQQSLCAPSRNSFLTSRRPDTLHLYDFYSYWRTAAGNFTTIPQFFKDNGFHTKSIGKVFHPGISSNENDDQPYSWSEKPFHPFTDRFKEAPVCPNKNHNSLGKNIVCPIVVKFQPGRSLPDLQSLENAKKFLSRPLEKPFFLAIGFHKPHIPLKFPREYLDFHPLDKVSLASNRWHPYGMPTVAWNPWTDLRQRDDIKELNLTFPFEPIPDDYSQLIRQSYYAAVSYIDDLVGQLLVELDHTGKANNTSILLIGDHGWSMGEHGEWSKYSNFDISVRVPFILHIPNRTTHGKISKELVELVDIFPTLVDMADLPALPLCPKKSNLISLCTEGSSIVPLLERSVRQWKMGAFSQYPRPGLYPMQHPNTDKPRLSQIKIMGYSLRTRRHRFTEWVQFDRKHFQPVWSNIFGTELYDLHLDPEENMNLFDRKEMIVVVNQLRKQLRAGWRHSLPVLDNM